MSRLCVANSKLGRDEELNESVAMQLPGDVGDVAAPGSKFPPASIGVFPSSKA